MPASGVQNSTAQIIEPGDATIEVPLGRFAVCDMKQTVGLHVKKAPDKAEDEYHAKVLALVFRPQTPTHFMSVSNQPMPHLLQNFWAKLKKKLT